MVAKATESKVLEEQILAKTEALGPPRGRLGIGFRAYRVEGLGFRGLEFRVRGLGFRVQGLGFRV